MCSACFVLDFGFVVLCFPVVEDFGYGRNSMASGGSTDGVDAGGGEVCKCLTDNNKCRGTVVGLPCRQGYRGGR